MCPTVRVDLWASSQKATHTNVAETNQIPEKNNKVIEGSKKQKGCEKTVVEKLTEHPILMSYEGLRSCYFKEVRTKQVWILMVPKGVDGRELIIWP